MSTVVLTAVLGFATFTALWAACSAGARWLPLGSRRSSNLEARAFFARAVIPTVAPALVVAVLVVPSFLLHEPWRDDEWPGLLLAGLAAIGACRIAIVLVRAGRALCASRRLLRTWLREATPLPLQPWGMRASCIDSGFPVVAVAGLWRPHVFVDRRVLDMCSAAELAAVAGHERAHVSAFDNLRRLFVVACDGHAGAKAVEWRAAAERAADDRAVDSPKTAADLAGALVRVARLAPAPILPIAAISTIDDGGCLEQRVRRLLTFVPDGRQPDRPTWPGIAGAIAIGVALMIATPLPFVLHGALEVLVQRLP